MTADPAGQELTIGERVDYTRAHLPATQRERYEQELRESTEQALDTGDYGPLGDAVERWWRAARLEDRGGSLLKGRIGGRSGIKGWFSVPVVL